MEKPIIIAECCQNHNGDMKILEQMVHKARPFEQQKVVQTM